MTDVITTTSSSFEGKKIKKYLEVVSADIIVGVKISDLLDIIIRSAKEKIMQIEGIPASTSLKDIEENRIKEILDRDMRNAFSTWCSSYADNIADARHAALGYIVENAQGLGANGIIDIKFNYESIVTDSDSVPTVSICRMLMVSVTGTAVVI